METLKEDSKFQAGWAGFVVELYREGPPDRDLPGDAPAQCADLTLSCYPPNVEETGRKVNQVKNKKASGKCGIYA